MKTTLAFLSLLSSVTFATAAQPAGFTGVGENVVCSTDADNATKCKKLTQKELVTPAVPAWGTAPYYVYKSQEKDSISYSDSAPSHKNYKKIDLNSPKMKEKITFYKTDTKLLEKAKKDRYDARVDQEKQSQINYVRDSLANARGALYNLRPETDNDWTYSGRTRVLSPYYVEKQLMLKKEIVKLEIQLENMM
jgi:hypothetical protein